MADRSNPIKFGPEWLRNCTSGVSQAGSDGGTNVTGSSVSSSQTTGTSTNTTSTRVQLSSHRYGKEEMLALYNRNSIQAPSELRQSELLYMSRDKQPVALNNTFDNERTGVRPSLGGGSTPDRASRGTGFRPPPTPPDNRGRARSSYVRTAGRGNNNWFLNRTSNEEEPSSSRTWNQSVGRGATNRSVSEQDWKTGNRMFRPNRPANNNTGNWRASNNTRTTRQGETEREWSAPERQQQYSNTRRPWLGGDSQNTEENLPEWAVAGAEAGAGSFDSSGAFHGYSNDDTNLPRNNQETAYPLTRSHTQGSFARSRSGEDSNEWWASEKAKKLSPKRFDATDILFKSQRDKSTTSGIYIISKPVNNDDSNETQEKATPSVSPDSTSENSSDKKNFVKSKFGENYNAMIRTNVEETIDGSGNIHSVMLNQNNTLRQKHQNLVHASKASLSEISDISLGSSFVNNLLGNLSLSSLNLDDSLLGEDNNSVQLDSTVTNDPEYHPSGLQGSGLSTGMQSTLQQELQASVLKASLIQSSGMHQTGLHNPGLQNSGIQSGLQNTGLQPNSMQVGAMQASILQKGGLQPGLQGVGMQGSGIEASGMQTGIKGTGIQTSSLQGLQTGLQGSGLQAVALQAAALQASNMQASGLPANIHQGSGLQVAGMQPGLQGIQTGMQSIGLKGGMQGLQAANLPGTGLPVGIQGSGLQSGGLQQVGLQGGLPGSALQSGGMQAPGLHGSRMQSSGVVQGSMMQNGPQHMNLQGSGIPGVTNSTLNASLVMPIGPNNNSMEMQGMMANNRTRGGAGSMFLGWPMSDFGSTINPPGNMYQVQHNSVQTSFGSMNSIDPLNASSSSSNNSDDWYYEDPNNTIQGPFSSKDMYSWYMAGFFTPSLMVKRACDPSMRPLGSYGPVVPFSQVVVNMPPAPENKRDPMTFDNTGLFSNPTYGTQHSPMDNVWMQQLSPAEQIWMQYNRNENHVNNLSKFFWEQSTGNVMSKSMLPEDITKEMKTEDQILAQLRATQKLPPLPQNLPFIDPVTGKKEEVATAPGPNVTPDLGELQKIIQKESLVSKLTAAHEKLENQDVKKQVKTAKADQSPVEDNKPVQNVTKSSDAKAAKPAKSEIDKTKVKDANGTKSSKKKSKDDTADTKKEEEIKAEKKTKELSPSKSKKEEKQSKKDKENEKDKKEWMTIKDGFDMKTQEKVTKESKKKAEELRAAEEAERKRKEEEKLALEEERKKKMALAMKKQQEQQQQQQAQRQAESVMRKAPWSAVGSQVQMTSKDGLTLAEIQRLEREKKLEQMREQQQMMHIIAQQQAAALAREQEMQASLGWAKKKAALNMNTQGQSLVEIQAEARKQASVAAAAAAAIAAANQVLDEAPTQPVNNVPWGNNNNNNNNNTSGFWDTKPSSPSKAVEKPQELPKVIEPPKKKKTPVVIAKKEVSPAHEFEAWCISILSSWSSKIDVPTFVGFLKDIESPYEIKDYVKCYLGDSKESNDFARQFLERRSKLLRVGMVTPSDDLCSPAVAVNPRTTSGSDYQEVKGKGKKTKKNKMLKVDARILGFSVTAAEDRINVGDIDTA